MADPEALNENHDLSRTIQFRVKSGVLTALRHARNTFLDPVEKFSIGNRLHEAEVVPFLKRISGAPTIMERTGS